MKDSLELINRHSDEAKKIEKDIINLEVIIIVKIMKKYMNVALCQIIYMI